MKIFELAHNSDGLKSEFTGIVDRNPFPFDDKVLGAKFLLDRPIDNPTVLKDGRIVVRELTIDDKLNPDIALINAIDDTPVQRYDGEGKITDIFIKTRDNLPIGVIMQDPSGKIISGIFDPLKHGGPRGYTIEKGWTMQTILPKNLEDSDPDKNPTLVFLDYWYPRGFCDKPEEGEAEYYGETVLFDIPEEDVNEDFKKARTVLEATLDRIVSERLGK